MDEKREPKTFAEVLVSSEVSILASGTRLYRRDLTERDLREAYLAGQRAMREAAAAAVRAEENRQTERPIWDPVSLPAMILDLPLLDPDQEGEDPGHGPDNCKGRIVPWIAEDGSCVLGERCADCRCTWMNTVPTPIGCTEYVPDSYDGPGTCGRCGETHPTDEDGNVLDRTWCPERGEE